MKLKSSIEVENFSAVRLLNLTVYTVSSYNTHVNISFDTIKVSLFVVEPLVYFAFLFLMKTVITKTQGLVVAIAKREYINKSNKCIII